MEGTIYADVCNRLKTVIYIEINIYSVLMNVNIEVFNIMLTDFYCIAFL